MARRKKLKSNLKLVVNNSHHKLTEVERVAILLTGWDDYTAADGEENWCGFKSHNCVMYSSQDMQKTWKHLLKQHFDVYCSRPKGHSGPHIAHQAGQTETPIGVME